jgi:hypothetical protein
LTWFAYLTSARTGTYAGGDEQTRRITKPKISIKPTARSIFTLTKAPMAHKTFSQEQLLFQFYKFSIKFIVQTTTHLSLNQSIYVLLRLRQSVPVTETNILFLTRFNLKLVNSDTCFFTQALELR